MNILVHEHDIIAYGDIKKGYFKDVDEHNELYRVTNEGLTYYVANTSDYILHEVSELPSDFEPMKYCYTEEDGFYENPNKPLPSEIERIATLESENDYFREQLAVQDELLAELLLDI